MTVTVCLPATELISIDAMASVDTVLWWCRLCNHHDTATTRPTAHSKGIEHLSTEHHATIAEVARKAFEDQRDRGQPLLAVDDKQRRLGGDLIQALLNVDDGADEVRGDGVVAAGAQDVVPKLATLTLGPGIGALINRDDELRPSFDLSLIRIYLPPE
jgi:hypothetical protein